MDLDIDRIIHETQRRVKGYSEQDKENFKSFEELDSDDWIDKLLTSEKQGQKPVDNTIRKAKHTIDRRITDGDFRDRFPDTDTSEVERRTKTCLTKSLEKFTQSYTRSLRLVTELEDSYKYSRQSKTSKP